MPVVILGVDIRRVVRTGAVGKDTLGGGEALRLRTQRALLSIAGILLVYNVLARGNFRYMRQNWEIVTSFTIILMVTLLMVRLLWRMRERLARTS